MVAIVIGVIAFALPVSTPDAPSSTTTRIPLRYNRESASKQKRMPSYGYDEQILCWYDGNILYFEFQDIVIEDDCTIVVSSNDSYYSTYVSVQDMMQGIEIESSGDFNITLFIPGVGMFKGCYEDIKY